MTIHVTGRYKSLSTFTSDEITSFAVVTGHNGSGKTQLIELVKSISDHNLRQQKEYSDVKVTLVPTTSRIQIEGLHFSSISILTEENFKSAVNRYLQQYNSLRPNLRKIYQYLIKKQVSKKDLQTNSLSETFKDWPEAEISETIQQLTNDMGLFASGQEFNSNLRQFLINSFREIELYSL